MSTKAFYYYSIETILLQVYENCSHVHEASRDRFSLCTICLVQQFSFCSQYRSKKLGRHATAPDVGVAHYWSFVVNESINAFNCSINSPGLAHFPSFFNSSLLLFLSSLSVRFFPRFLLDCIKELSWNPLVSPIPEIFGILIVSFTNKEWLFTAIQTLYYALAALESCGVLRQSDVSIWTKPLLLCPGRQISVSQPTSLEVYCPVAQFLEKLYYRKGTWHGTMNCMGNLTQDEGCDDCLDYIA